MRKDYSATVGPQHYVRLEVPGRPAIETALGPDPERAKRAVRYYALHFIAGARVVMSIRDHGLRELSRYRFDGRVWQLESGSPVEEMPEAPAQSSLAL